MSSNRSPGSGASAFVGGLMFILLFSGFGGGGDAAPAPPVIAECSDGIDNDGDGGIDNSGTPHDPECHFTDPFTGITYQCPGWLSESIAPTTHIDCVS